MKAFTAGLFMLVLAGCGRTVPEARNAELCGRLTSIAVALNPDGKVESGSVFRTLQATEPVRRHAKGDLETLLAVHGRGLTPQQKANFDEAIQALADMQREVDLVNSNKDSKTSFDEYLALMQQAKASVTAAAATF